MAIVAVALMTGGTILAPAATATVSNSAGLPAEISAAEQQAILSETNSVRQQAGQSALTWDSALAAEAQSWADDPASTSGGQLHHAAISNAAENMSGYPPNQATGQWASEKSVYDADPNHDPFANQAGYYRWGHYYNMINGSYHRMGCGAKSGVPISGAGWVTVCRYGS
ncbi:CAP domain-containing protein [Kitasatospora sp. GP82]|uniref:CAP domain-containing protein n=1 Tax=Kitasatospora sp. GP82 TaxID=3035089 RepID=UPI002473C3F5|nr:CAP domain-containing protein [Kitasatospora sp. GP82]